MAKATEKSVCGSLLTRVEKCRLRRSLAGCSGQDRILPVYPAPDSFSIIITLF
jgi:hypothetical protein